MLMGTVEKVGGVSGRASSWEKGDGAKDWSVRGSGEGTGGLGLFGAGEDCGWGRSEGPDAGAVVSGLFGADDAAG